MCLRKRAAAWLLPLFLFGLLSACGGAPSTSQANAKIRVVAAENFYGDIASQLGGRAISVTSVLSDPSVDPHEYQSNVRTGLAVSRANLVIENGAGYDDWMDKILAAAPEEGRLLLTAYAVAPIRLPENEHVWYSFTDIAAIAQAITADLKRLDPADATTFERNLQTFKESLQPLEQKLAAVKAKYQGTPVGLTETIYLYQAQQMGLDVLTPFAFEKAVAEGNDPPADTVMTMTDQINTHQIKALIYNAQTLTPITTNMQNLARAQHIPTVPMTETMPQHKTYQTWMRDQLMQLETALGA